jgi:hypothetical protein
LPRVTPPDTPRLCVLSPPPVAVAQGIALCVRGCGVSGAANEDSGSREK